MKPTHKKIVVGFVVQTYSNGTPISQEFIAEDQVTYENLDGEPLEEDPSMEVYLPLDMEQPG